MLGGGPLAGATHILRSPSLLSIAVSGPKDSAVQTATGSSYWKRMARNGNGRSVRIRQPTTKA